MENQISESGANHQTEQTMIDLTEDDSIQHGENPQEYHDRLLRMINANDFTSMDHYDRFHAYNVFMNSIKDDYKGKSLPPLIVRVMDRKGRSQNATALRVTGIVGKPTRAMLQGVPASAGGHRSYHGREEEQDARLVSGIVTSNYAFMKPEHIDVIRKIANFRGLKEMFEPLEQLILEAKKKSKKPYKGFKKGKNHPEGGLSRAEARRQGIHAGIETKEEAKRKGGFNKLSGKTKKRRKSFCARMCGMKRRRTSAKTARDPKSKINAALRVWGCKCGSKSRKSLKEEFIGLILEKKKMKNPCWKGYEAIGMKKKNGRKVPNCVPVSESKLNNIQFRVKEKFLSEGCGCGGGNQPQPKPRPKPKPRPRPKNNITEEVVNSEHKGRMTDSMVRSRDRRRKRLKGKVKIVKKGDTKENAEYRLATYIEWLKHGKRSKGGKKERTK